MVEHYVRDVGAASSNLVTSTIYYTTPSILLDGVFFCYSEPFPETEGNLIYIDDEMS